MGVRNFFNKTVYVQRMRSGGGYKRSYSTTATADASIQKADPEHGQTVNAVEGRGWYGYFEEDEDIQVDDVIIDSDSGSRYLVREITKIDWGINTHLEVLLEDYNE